MMMRALWIALALVVLAAGDALAAARACTSVAAACDADSNGYCEWADTDTWGAAEPTAADDVTISGTCKVECTGVQCHANTVLTATDATAVMRVESTTTAQGLLDMDACDTASAQSATICGGTEGVWEVQGVVVNTSANMDWTTGSVPASGATIRMYFSSAAPSPAPIAGDWLRWDSGAGRGSIYQITGLSFAGCPTAGLTCYIDIKLYDAGMAYANKGGAGWGLGESTTDFDTTNRATDVRVMDGSSTTLPKGEKVGLGWGGHTYFSSRTSAGGNPIPMDRCVELCNDDGGATNDPDTCTTATMIGEDGAYVGWSMQFQGSSAAVPGANFTFQAQVVESFNDITCAGGECIHDNAAVVDVVCLDRSIPMSLLGTTARTFSNATLVPPMSEFDDFTIFRPAVVKAIQTAGDPDQGFSLRTGASPDIDYAYFDGWAKVFVENPTVENAVNELIVRPEAGTSAVATDDNNCGNGYAANFWSYDSLVMDGVYVIDAAYPLNGTAAGNGATSFCTGDTDDSSGIHGLVLNENTSLSLTDVFTRYIGDDGILVQWSTANTVASADVAISRPYQFWAGIGDSTEGIQITDADTAHAITVDIDNARIVGWNVDASTCAPAIKVQSDDAGNTAVVTIRDTQVLNPVRQGNAVLFSGVGTITGTTSNLYSVEQLRSGDCSLTSGGAQQSLTNSYAKGYARAVSAPYNQIARNLFWGNGGSSSSAVVSVVAPNVAAVFHDNMFMDLPNVALLDAAAASGSTLNFYRNYFRWPTTGADYVFNPAGAGIAIAADGIRDNIIVNRLLANYHASWVTNGCDEIAANTVVNPSGAAIGTFSSCPNAVAPYILSSETLNGGEPLFLGSGMGPQGLLGVPPTSSLLSLLPADDSTGATSLRLHTIHNPAKPANVVTY